MIAVIDCGTNTFNLLIAKVTGNEFKFEFHTKIPVSLGQGGIDKGILSEPAFERGINALIDFKKIADEWNVEKIVAMGTAALRDASNGKSFIQTCKEKTGITIELIEGEREAELIWKAARNCVQLNGKYLVMDIGGGSNEFIIADHEKIYWKKSYRLGLSRLKETFRFSNDPSEKEIHELAFYLESQMEDLFGTCLEYGIETLIGTAGTFDTYASIFSYKETGTDFDIDNKSMKFDSTALLGFCREFTTLPKNKRDAVEGIPQFRKEFMIYATLLTQVVMEKCIIKSTYLSTYALKEGILIESFNL
jgi:exopolyphosphatase/guanosine-5'-triphosphate,3'-diphosphate pyrophosphatase